MMRILAAVLLFTFPGGLTNAEFDRLRKEVHIRSKPWATIPWQGSITEARELAFRTKKPIFMMVDAGNPVGFA